MSLFLFGAAWLALFLFGVLVMALVIKVKYGDSTATYPLYEVRDNLIESVVLGSVSREDPWLVAMYENLNVVLRHSNFVAGPGDGWNRAEKIGKLMVERPSIVQPLSFPNYLPPAPLEPLARELYKRLDVLTRSHQGLLIQRGSEQSQRRRQQQQQAKKMRSELRSSPLGPRLAAC